MFLRVVTARLDQPKIDVLLGLGLAPTERWWVKPVIKPVIKGSGPGRELSVADGAGFRIDQMAAPPVYDPGGPVGMVTGFTTAAALADAEAAVVGTDIVLLIAPQTPGSDTEVDVDAAGFEIASEFYQGVPVTPRTAGQD